MKEVYKTKGKKKIVHKAYTLVNKIVSHMGIDNNSDTDEHVYEN